MNRKELWEAMDSLTPDQQTKQKMLLALREKASKPARKRFPLWGGAAVVAVAFLILWMVVPRGSWFLPNQKEALGAQEPAAMAEQADTVSAPRAEATSSPTVTAEEEPKEVAIMTTESADVQDVDGYADGEYWVMAIRETENLDSLVHLIPEDAVLIEAGGRFRRYQVGEEIWEIQIVEGVTRLVKPLE